MRGICKWVVVVAAMAAILAACDSQRVQALSEGVSSEAEVRREFGAPEAIWDGADGARIFEYNRQPAGQRNYQITIGADGRMTALRQLLTPENFARIEAGMPMERVRKTLGKPARIAPRPLKQEIDYDWRYVVPNNVPMLFTVTFDSQYHVLRTASTPDPSAEAQRGGGGGG